MSPSEPCETHNMYGRCPEHLGPYDTPEPELNVEAKAMQAVIDLVFAMSDGGYKITPHDFEHWEEPLPEWLDLLALIQQVSDQRVREAYDAGLQRGLATAEGEVKAARRMQELYIAAHAADPVVMQVPEGVVINLGDGQAVREFATILKNVIHDATMDPVIDQILADYLSHKEARND